MEFDDLDHRINDTICAITGADRARDGQIKAVRRLAFDKEDTVLIAATGYGKSAVLYAFSALTSKITIQIVPLTKLGENQRDDIQRNVTESSPVWIDGDTHLKNPKIWDQVRNGDHSHVLLSPEQAVSPKFKSILRDPEFHYKIGMFAIDELHVVGEWREFRKDFTYLYSLRALLPRWVPWFGCTATLDRDNQDFILQHAGFDQRRLKIVRTSVDRPEISLVVQPLVRGYTKNFRRLNFLLAGASSARIRDIPKTIVYIDSKQKLLEARWSLCRYAQEHCGFSEEFARKAIQRYDADVRDADKEIIFNNLAADTDCRIVLATVSLGMGMGIPDIVMVVQFGLPKNASLSDIWQRFSRAMRNKQKVMDKGFTHGTAYLFVPYWVFSHLGGTDQPAPKAKQPRRRAARQRQAHAPAISSRLREMTLIDRGSDDEASQASQDSQAVSLSSQAAANAEAAKEQEEAAALRAQGLWDFETRVKWNRNDLAARAKLDPVIHRWLNSGCFRKSALEYLQEPSLDDEPDLEYRTLVDPEFCCNGANCNRTLGRIPPLEPRHKGKQRPSKGSLPDFALEQMSIWCKAQAQGLVAAESRHFDIVGELWMDIRLQYAVARLFSEGPRGKVPFHDVTSLAQKLPDIKDWEMLNTSGLDLVAFCTGVAASVFEAHKEDKRRKNAEKATRRSSGALVSAGSGTESQVTDEGRRKRAADPPAIEVSPAPKR